MKTVTVTELRRRPGAVKRLAEEQGYVVITRRGKPVSAMLSLREYDRLRTASELPPTEPGADDGQEKVEQGEEPEHGFSTVFREIRASVDRGIQLGFSAEQKSGSGLPSTLTTIDRNTVSHGAPDAEEWKDRVLVVPIETFHKMVATSSAMQSLGSTLEKLGFTPIGFRLRINKR